MGCAVEGLDPNLAFELTQKGGLGVTTVSQIPHARATTTNSRVAITQISDFHGRPQTAPGRLIQLSHAEFECSIVIIRPLFEQMDVVLAR